jgi:type VI secretion system protein ImpE
MTAAESHFKSGNLAACIEELQSEVRKRPADAKLRIFLAQVFMITGEWVRALDQLGVVAEMEAAAIPMVHAYRSAIQCEQLRRDVFRGIRSPLVFGDPQPWVAQLVQALSLQSQGHYAEANATRAQALQAAPAVAGTLNGSEFEWIADADSRIGPVLEVLLNGAYYWVPFEHIRKVTVEIPADARDLVWIPAEFTWTNGGQAYGMIPVRYPESERSGDDGVRLSRKTDWQPIGGDAYAGLGQRVLSTSGDELGLLEVRELAMAASG